MPWVRAKLRGQTVYARASATGELVAESGRVEIRYNKDDGRLYRAGLGNLEVTQDDVLPDDTCGSADEVERSKSDGGGNKAGAKKSGSKKSAAKRRKKTASVVDPPTEAPAGGAIAYTDGACSGNPGPAGLGLVVLSQTERIERYEYLGEATNNIAELTAILRAVEEIAPTVPATILTDSQYAIGVLQKGWKAKANRELIATMKKALNGRPIELVYVKGHAGILLNERADELARQAVEERGDGRSAVPVVPA